MLLLLPRDGFASVTFDFELELEVVIGAVVLVIILVRATSNFMNAKKRIEKSMRIKVT